MAKILRKSRGSISKFQYFFSQKSILRHYYFQNVKDGIQTRVYNISKDRINYSSQFISAKVKKIL